MKVKSPVQPIYKTLSQSIHGTNFSINEPSMITVIIILSLVKDVFML